MVDKAIDIAGDLDIAKEVVSDNGLEVGTGISIVIGIVDVSDIVIDACIDVGSVVDRATNKAGDLDIATEVVSNNSLEVDTGVSIVIGIVDVLDIAMDVCSDVGSVVDRATDIAGDLDIAIEVISDNDLVDTGVSIVIMVDFSDIAIDVCFDVGSVVDTWMSWWFIACLHAVPFLPSSSTAM